MAKAKGEVKVKKKLSLGLVLVIVLVLAAVTALAAVLNGYFSGFAKLEGTYGQYEQWPSNAKVELVQLMLDNKVLTETDVPEWTALTESEKEILAEQCLSQYYEGMTYLDTYNAMTHELGSIENWTDEQRALYTSLLEQYGKLTDEWPVYTIPGQNDLSREQAVSQARDAVLKKFSISDTELDNLSVNAIFAVDAFNTCGASKEEPFWIVEFGYGMAYRVYMTRNGEMLGMMGPQTLFIPWGRGIMDKSTQAAPGTQDANRDEAILAARSALTEIMNVSNSDMETMNASAYFIYSDLYVHGDEPVWVVVWSKHGEDLWQVLLGYDGSYIDAEPAGKLFDNVLRNEISLSDLCASRYDTLGMQNPITGSRSYYWWSLDEKAAFYQAFADFVNNYAVEHPYFRGDGCSEWEWTRNVSSLPSPEFLSQEEAQKIAISAIEAKLGRTVDISDYGVFYYVTNPERPEWRFANAFSGITIDAKTGEVLALETEEHDEAYSISHFLAEVIPSVCSE